MDPNSKMILGEEPVSDSKSTEFTSDGQASGAIKNILILLHQWDSQQEIGSYLEIL